MDPVNSPVSQPLSPIKIGLLGAGQLGRMLALAGYPLGLEFYFYDPSPEACARHLGHFVQGEWEDKEALSAFCDEVDILSYETENIPLHLVQFLKTRDANKLFPQLLSLETAQDRYLEKTFFKSLQIKTPDFFPADAWSDVKEIVAHLGLPLILKTRRSGYDGKGQFWIETEQDLERLSREWEQRFPEPSKADVVLEKKCQFIREWSLIATRSHQGQIAFYDLCLNEHESGILNRTQNVNLAMWDMPDLIKKQPVFSALKPAAFQLLQEQAKTMLRSILEKMAYVGVLTLEFFEVDGELWANEMAPRVHNSGHWTLEGAVTSQFENHLRAILGWPLGDPASVGLAEMFNWIGQCPPITPYLRDPHAHIHVYGKTPKSKRKVGHVTKVFHFDFLK